MSLILGLLDIIEQEAASHDLSRILRVRVKHGALAAVVPEAMLFAWDAVTRQTPLEGVALDLEEVPVRLRCSICGFEFAPVYFDHRLLCVPCPSCGEELGHQVLEGKELYLDHLEAE